MMKLFAWFHVDGQLHSWDGCSSLGIFEGFVVDYHFRWFTWVVISDISYFFCGLGLVPQLDRCSVQPLWFIKFRETRQRVGNQVLVAVLLSVLSGEGALPTDRLRILVAPDVFRHESSMALIRSVIDLIIIIIITIIVFFPFFFFKLMII